MSFSDITQNKTSQFRCIIMTTLAAFYNKFHIWLSTTFFDFETVNGVKFEHFLIFKVRFCVHEIPIFVLCLTLSEWDIGYRRTQLSWQNRCKWQIVMTFYAINMTSFNMLSLNGKLHKLKRRHWYTPQKAKVTTFARHGHNVKTSA